MSLSREPQDLTASESDTLLQDADDTKEKNSDAVEININEVSRENALEDFLEHFIKEKNGDPIPFDRGSKVGLALEILGGTGGIYAWPPALKYGSHFSPWIKYSFAVSNPISNALFLMKATDDLIGTIRAEASVPEEIKRLMNVDEKTKKELIQKYVKIGLGSLVCVIPFAIAVYLFPIPGCEKDLCLGLTVLHSTVSNTILHGIAWALVFTPQFWYYRLPTLPIEKLYSVVKNSLYSPEEREHIRLTREQIAIVSKYKNHLAQVFIKTSHELVKQKRPSRQIENAKQNSSLFEIEQNQISLVKFVEFAGLDDSSQRRLSAVPPSFARRTLNCVHGFMSNGGIGFLGGSIMVAGCIGWVANPIYVSHLEGLSLTTSILVGALPLYSTAILCAFYGAAISNQFYNYLTTWTGSFSDKFSPEIRMYPITFLLFTLFNTYVSFFSFATATQLINTIFADQVWDSARPILTAISIPTLQLLSFVPLMELFNLVVRKIQANGSRENDDTLTARLLVKMPLITHYLQEMKSDELMKSLAQYSPTQQKSLGIDPQEFQADLKQFTQLSSSRNTLFSQHGSKKILPTETTALVLKPTG